jgi:hypothetical protein
MQATTPDADGADPRTRDRHDLRIRLETVEHAHRVLGRAGASAALTEIGKHLAGVRRNLDTVAEERTALNDLRMQIAALEDALLAVDRTVPHTKFELACETADRPRYARFLLTRQLRRGSRRQRFDAIVSDSLCIVGPDGRLTIRPADDARPILTEIVGGLAAHRSDPKTRDRVNAFLAESSERLAKLRSLDAFFDDGFYLDSYGFQMTLDRELLDPAVLYALTTYRAEVENHLRALAASTPFSVVETRLAAQRTEVDDLLGGTSEPPIASSQRPMRPAAGAFSQRPSRPAPGTLSQRPSRRPSAAPSSSGAGPSKTSGVSSRRPQHLDPRADLRRVLLAAAVLIVALIGIGYHLTRVLGTSDFEPLDRGELSRISPLLVRGWMSGRDGEQNRRFRGSISSAAFSDPDADETRALSDLGASLKQRGVIEADVDVGNRIVLQLRNGAPVTPSR